jgi:shikimate kinase
MLLKNIVLTGIMGCGKTTVAAILSEDLGMPYVDTDEMVEKAYGSIPKLFEKGEEFFRDAESRVVEEVSGYTGHVVSTGGGVVLRKGNMDALKRGGIVFFIDRPVDMIIDTIDTSNRPLLASGSQALREIYEKRYPLYVSSCDYRIFSDGAAADAARAIKEILRDLGLLDA